MITHVVMFSWAPGVTDEQVAALGAVLDTLPGAVPEVRRYVHGRNAGLAAGNADYVVVATFDDADGWRAYDTHPEHQRIRAEVIKPLIASRSAVQFEH